MSDRTIEIHAMREVASQFKIGGTVVRAEPYGSGHINDTFAVYFKDAPRPRYIFQRMNTKIFKHPEHVMENIVRATDHIRKKSCAAGSRDLERATLTVVQTNGGGSFLRTASGECWRSYVFIEGATTYDVLTKPVHAYEAAKTFGAFQCMLADIPAPPMHDIIAFFHHTPKRVEALKEAIARDVAGRVKAAGPEIEFALAREKTAGVIVEGMATGRIPVRVTHNDTKINNVMIDDKTDKGVCAIDLDSIMTGSALYDFGDMVRTAAATSLEDELDLDKCGVNLDMFEQLVRGYSDSARGFLVKDEYDLMAFSGRLITYMIGVRFLTDFLSGDTYFKIKRQTHNIERCRTQFKMVDVMERQQKEMEAIVARYK